MKKTTHLKPYALRFKLKLIPIFQYQLEDWVSIYFNSISVNFKNDFKNIKRIGRLECLRYLEAQKNTRKKWHSSVFIFHIWEMVIHLLFGNNSISSMFP